MAEYSIYPFEYMRITQRHDEGNHLPHWYPTANCSDKPWDEAVKDGNRQYFDPSNEYRIVEILGLGTTTTNSVRLESVEKLKIPYQEEPVILEVTLTHMEEETIKQLKTIQSIGDIVDILALQNCTWAQTIEELTEEINDIYYYDDECEDERLSTEEMKNYVFLNRVGTTYFVINFE